jgi:hypothetical protein
MSLVEVPMRDDAVSYIIKSEILSDESERFPCPDASVAGGRDNLKTLSPTKI